ncbi:MBL fold metallo-hydrolase [Zavarzinia compransoris]|uniref:MBL fold metallo-hydrolase n=1 Tax=Zavarzinia compransoris TaxID=1264899 RepID=A0A317DTQ9_9PROT|nr:MBL fold metallo-hydrolase [Zavarzinia compransoris]PWR18077.1 MBL fold metallo-hydrolase [Zavarzinia compransoris]TDP43449.1 ribonuclease Z [Zavarzinia compransoris]
MARVFRRLAVVAAVLAVGLAAVWFTAGDRLVLALAARMAGANMAADRAATLPDGLHLAVCGAGGPMPDALRSGPCQLVVAGTFAFMVDAGSMGARNLARMGFRNGGITAILLTHFHSDHIDGLGEAMMLRWTAGSNREPVPVYGPPGVEMVLEGFHQAYAQDAQYRTAHHGPDVMPPGGAGGVPKVFPEPQGDEGVVVFERDGVKITAFSVNYAPVHPAVGYRFDYKGRSLVVSGDTGPAPVLDKFAAGADLLAHEALAPALVAALAEAAEGAGRGNLAHVMHDIPDYHTTPAQAAALAARAGVKQLVLTHITPPLPSRLLDRVFLDGVAAVYDGPVTIARDGDLFSLPAGTTAIVTEHLF